MLINAVAPFAGAWIEIEGAVTVSAPSAVAPFAGAWIEIELKRHSIDKIWSLPSRERGLK